MATGSGPTSGSSSGGAGSGGTRPGSATTNRRKRPAAAAGGGKSAAGKSVSAKSGSAKSGSGKSAAKVGGKPTRARKPAAPRRRTSKPLIVDVEPVAVRSTASRQAGKPADPSASAKPSHGIGPDAARQAGLFAGAGAQPGPDPKAKPASASSVSPSSVSPSSASPSSTPEASGASASSSAQTPETPSGGGAGPSPFYLFAAGLIGALLALALMFLAIVSGMIAPRDDRVDQQAQALSTLTDRVTGRLMALETDMAAVAERTEILGDRLDPLETQIAALDIVERARPDSAAPVSEDTAVSLDALRGEIEAGQVALDSLAGEVGAQIAALQTALAALTSDGDGDVGAPAVDAALVADLSGELASLSDRVAAFDDAVARLETGLADQAMSAAALEASVDDVAGDVAALGEDVQRQQAVLDTASGEAARAADEAARALAQQQSGPAPDAQARIDLAVDGVALARIGLALDGVVQARGSGAGIPRAVEALQAAAASDDGFAGALAPLSGLGFVGPLSDAALLATYAGQEATMRAAAPVREDGGLLGALEDRARQMVTIRGPQPEASDAVGTVMSAQAQIDRLGALIAAGAYDAALSLANDLPAEVQAASGGLMDALQARTALDAALAAARAVLTDRLIADAAGADDAGVAAP